MYARLGNALLAISLVFVFSAGSVTSTRATGATGPIQLGGDDSADHGYVKTEDLDGDPTTAATHVTPIETTAGWRYIMLSLKGMLATELRAGASNSIAVIGTDGSADYLANELPGITANDGGASCAAYAAERAWSEENPDVYCMMEVVKVELDRLNGATAAPTITYYETAEEVAALFSGLTAGTVNVAVIFMPGDDVRNAIDDGNSEDEVDDNTTVNSAMEQALLDSADDIALFNAQGGGVLASGKDHYLYWLTTLIPGIEINTEPLSDYVGMTADGAQLWPGLKDSEISSNWHAHFTGNFGALKALGRGYVDWVDTDLDGMIDGGEATPLFTTATDPAPFSDAPVQTVVFIGGAAGEAAIGEDLPETNTSGEATASWALLVAALAAVAGLALRVVERKRLQA